MKLKLGGMGWKRDLPDFRDYTIESNEIGTILDESMPLRVARRVLPRSVDLRQWCSPVEDQKELGSCSSQAGVGLMEYFQRRAFGKHLDMSRLFLYKVTRNLMGLTGDTGATLRATMKAMVKYGVPPESCWPYDISRFDEDPPVECFAFGQDFQAVKYYRLDSRRGSTSQTLRHVKKVLAAGLPVMFGFTVFSSIPGIDEGTGNIPMPQYGDSAEGGHAILACGFSDDHVIGEDKGALLIRNSWGPWGENNSGYGYLPYSYVEDGLAVDFWSLVQAEFVGTDLFC